MPRHLLLALAALLLAPATASAAPDLVVDFEAQAPNSTVSTAPGVNFGTLAQFNLPARPGPQDPRDCGAPDVLADGIDHTHSGFITCSSGTEIDALPFSTAMEFNDEHRQVSFRLRQVPRNSSTTDTKPATIRTFNISRQLLDTKTVNLPSNVTVPVTLTRPAADGGIAYVAIAGDGDYGKPYVLLDDIHAVVDDTPPPRKFSIAISPPSSDVTEGASTTVEVSARRFNGSTGPVTLTRGSLPSGIASADFDNPVIGGTNPVKLTIKAGAPATGQRQVGVSATGSASAGTAGVTSVIETLNLTPALELAAGSADTIVSSCGPQPITDFFTVHGGFAGSVYASTREATPVAASPQAEPAAISGSSGSTRVTIDPGGATSGSYVLRLSSSGATSVEARQSWRVDKPSVRAIGSPSINRPLADGDQTVSIYGNFPKSCAYTVKDDLGQNWPITGRDVTPIDVDDPTKGYEDGLQLSVPAKAVSSTLHVTGGTGVEVGSVPITIREFRRTYAFAVPNSGDGAKGSYIWDDFVRTFGEDDAMACFIACVRDPIAIGYYKSYQKGVNSGNGLCFGWSTMALRFRGVNGVVQRPSDYQAGATLASLVSPVVGGTQAKRDVIRWHVSQHDQGWQHDRSTAFDRGADLEKQILRSELAAQGAVMLLIRQGDSGHAIVATGIRDLGGGAVEVTVADPNVPFSPGELTDFGTRMAQIDTNKVVIKADGSWSGASVKWSGPNGTLAVVPGVTPDNATLPLSLSVLSLFDSAGDAPSPAKVTGVDSDAKPALDGTGEPLPGSGVTLDPDDTGAGAEPTYTLAPGRDYAFTVQGSGAGSYDQGLLGDGAQATVRGAATQPGQQDRLVVSPGKAQLGFSTGAGSAPVSYDLVDKQGKATRTALLDVTARKGGTDATELKGDVVTLTHQGAPTTASVTLGSVGEGLPGTVTTAPMKVGSGETVELRPTSWASLGNGVQVTVRNAKGKVLRTSNGRLRATKAVKLGKVGAKRKGKDLIVSGVVKKPGAAPVLVVTAQVGRDKKQTASLRGAAVKAGRFSLPVKLGKVGPRAKIKVTVVLLDEAAGLASARRELTVRG